MTAILAPSPNITEAPADDTPAEVRLAAVLHVHGADLLANAGHVTEQFWRDGRLHPWLLAGIKRSVASLNDALTAFEQETA